MTTSRIHRAALLLVALGAAGCGATKPARFYTLEAVATPTGAPAAKCAVAIGPVTIPPALDRPQLVVQVAPNRVEIDEFNRWAAPLPEGIAAAVAGDLAVLLGTADVVVGAGGGFLPTHTVALAVQRFAYLPGKEVDVDVLWSVRRTAGGEPRAGRTTVHEPVATSDVDAVAAAHSRALAKVSADVAAAIRAR
jgi:uncharacterized lipoprotein YmbA